MPTKYFVEKEIAIDKQGAKEKETKHEKSEKAEKEHKDQKDHKDNPDTTTKNDKDKNEKEAKDAKNEKEHKNEVKEHKNEVKEHKSEKEHKLEGKENLLEKAHKEAELQAMVPGDATANFKHVEIKQVVTEKPLYDTKYHKAEIKEYKHEQKEFKLEKWEHKHEKIEFETLPNFPGEPGGPVEERLAALESAMTQLMHFIPENLRPDLTQGALKQEADVAAKADAAKTEKAEHKTEHKAKS